MKRSGVDMKFIDWIEPDRNAVWLYGCYTTSICNKWVADGTPCTAWSDKHFIFQLLLRARQCMLTALQRDILLNLWRRITHSLILTATLLDKHYKTSEPNYLVIMRAYGFGHKFQISSRPSALPKISKPAGVIVDFTKTKRGSDLI